MYICIGIYMCVYIYVCIYICVYILYIYIYIYIYVISQGFPAGSVGKESACNAGDTDRHALNPQVRKIP